MHKEDWDDLRIVLAVSRIGSFARAARVLEVNESTVVRKVAHAEQRFRARLFERKPGKVSTTEAGQELVLRAEEVESVIRDATNVIRDSDGQIAEIVRLTSVPLLVNRILIPELPKLVRQHPNLQVELVADARVLSLARREADIALRLARPTGGLRAIARKVGELSYAVYGPQGLETANLPWLTYESDQDSLPQAEWIARQIVNAARRRRCCAPTTVKACWLVLRQGSAKRCSPRPLATEHQVWFVCTRNRAILFENCGW